MRPRASFRGQLAPTRLVPEGDLRRLGGWRWYLKHSNAWRPPRCAPTCSSSARGRRGRRRRRGRPRAGTTCCWPTRRCSPATRRVATGSPRGRSASSRSSASRTGCGPTRSTRGCAPTGSARPCCCRGRAARLPAWGSAVARTELDDHLRTTAIKAGAEAVDGARAVGVRMDGDRVAAVEFARGSRQSVGGRALRGRLRPSRRGRRRALAARQAAGPGVAPRDRVRRRRAQLRRLHDVRRPVDQLPPRAARRAGPGAVGLRLDLPARQRRGERRCRHPGHGASGRPTSRSSR